MVEGAKPIESCLVEAKKGEPGAGGVGGVMILRPLCSLYSFVCGSFAEGGCMQALPASGVKAESLNSCGHALFLIHALNSSLPVPPKRTSHVPINLTL